jgi:hypothetical protein
MRGETIIRRFVRYDTDRNMILIEEEQPKPRQLFMNLALAETIHRVVAIGDPWPEVAT